MLDDISMDYQRFGRVGMLGMVACDMYLEKKKRRGREKEKVTGVNSPHCPMQRLIHKRKSKLSSS